MSKSFFIQTFGCQMNEHDSEIMAGMLIKKGYLPAADRKDANIVLFNTCSIRDNADKRFFGTLGQLKKKKMAEGENFTVCVTGCMMQQQHVIDTLKQKYPWVDVIIGTHNIHELPDLLDNLYKEKKKQLSVWPEGGDIVEGLPSKRLYKHKAYVNITFGCNNFCTYCIVPYTRGREKSRMLTAVTDEIKGLAADGVKEVMLLGQNVDSYRDAAGRSFADLIKAVNDIDGIGSGSQCDRRIAANSINEVAASLIAYQTAVFSVHRPHHGQVAPQLLIGNLNVRKRSATHQDGPSVLGILL